MMKILSQQSAFLITLLIINFSVFSQANTEIGIDYFDFKYLIEHDIDAANLYIAKKDFRFEEINSSNLCDTTVWTFNGNIKNDASETFISKNCTEPNVGFIWFQTGEIAIFERIKSQCKDLGFQHIRSETKNNDLFSYFEGIKYKIKFISGVDPNSNKNFYVIVFEITE